MKMQKKIAIIFHSVCGNTYLMAKEYEKVLQSFGDIQVDLFKVEDASFNEVADAFAASREYKTEIAAVPVITDIQLLLAYDAIFLGSPTYFGNVSAQMKAFMDSFSPLWADSLLYGKYFSSFASASTDCGGGDICLSALNSFAIHLGMTILAVPANLAGLSNPADGLLHISSPDSSTRLGDNMKMAVKDFLTRSLSIIYK